MDFPILMKLAIGPRLGLAFPGIHAAAARLENLMTFVSQATAEQTFTTVDQSVSVFAVWNMGAGTRLSNHPSASADGVRLTQETAPEVGHSPGLVHEQEDPPGSATRTQSREWPPGPVNAAPSSLF